ncbi:MAG: FHA domain-containing protein [Planctomycetaceae bacterium]
MITKLIVATGKSAGRAILIKRNTLLIGRAEECDVRPLSEDVSRRHAAVHVGPADVWVEDLGSRNGTFVNGERITGKVKVASGDLVRVGALEVRVSCTEPAAATGSDQDVSKWLMADESPAGMFDTTRSLKSTEPLKSAEPLKANSLPQSGAPKVAARRGDNDAGASSIHATPPTDPLPADGTGSMVSGITGGGSADPGTGTKAEPTGIGSSSATVPGGIAAAGGAAAADASKPAASSGLDALRDSKGKPGGLPANARKTAENSRDAAAEALKKFFSNR